MLTSELSKLYTISIDTIWGITGKFMLEQLGVTQEDKDILNKIYKEDTTQLIVLKYNEKNILPTIKCMVEDNKDSCIYFKYNAKKNISTKLQLKRFSKAINNSFEIELRKNIKHWTDAFIYLTRALTQKMEEKKDYDKVFIFLDEVSWLDNEKDSNFLNTFGYFYNTFCQKNKYFLIILGSSSISWIDNELRNNIGPLYQRIDKIIKIQ